MMESTGIFFQFDANGPVRSEIRICPYSLTAVLCAQSRPDLVIVFLFEIKMKLWYSMRMLT